MLLAQYLNASRKLLAKDSICAINKAKQLCHFYDATSSWTASCLGDDYFHFSVHSDVTKWLCNH